MIRYLGPNFQTAEHRTVRCSECIPGDFRWIWTRCLWKLKSEMWKYVFSIPSKSEYSTYASEQIGLNGTLWQAENLPGWHLATFTVKFSLYFSSLDCAPAIKDSCRQIWAMYHKAITSPRKWTSEKEGRVVCFWETRYPAELVGG